MLQRTQAAEYPVLHASHHRCKLARDFASFYRQRDKNPAAMVGIPLSRHQSTIFECSDGVGNVARIQIGRVAELGLAQLSQGSQRCKAAVLVSVDSDPSKVLVQSLMRASCS